MIFVSAFIASKLFAAPSNIWIGLNSRGTQKVFVWSSNDDVAYANWNSGEPNNYDEVSKFYLYSLKRPASSWRFCDSFQYVPTKACYHRLYFILSYNILDGLEIWSGERKIVKRTNCFKFRSAVVCFYWLDFQYPFFLSVIINYILLTFIFIVFEPSKYCKENGGLMLLLSNCCHCQPRREWWQAGHDWQKHIQIIMHFDFFVFGRSLAILLCVFACWSCEVACEKRCRSIQSRCTTGRIWTWCCIVWGWRRKFSYSRCYWAMYGNDVESRCSWKTERHALRRYASFLLFKGERPQYSCWWVTQLRFSGSGYNERGVGWQLSVGHRPSSCKSPEVISETSVHLCVSIFLFLKQQHFSHTRSATVDSLSFGGIFHFRLRSTLTLITVQAVVFPATAKSAFRATLKHLCFAPEIVTAELWFPR